MKPARCSGVIDSQTGSRQGQAAISEAVIADTTKAIATTQVRIRDVSTQSPVFSAPATAGRDLADSEIEEAGRRARKDRRASRIWP